ncbi:MAG: MBL fold metallo-hydrolase [Dehalococcoidia bacterium]
MELVIRVNGRQHAYLAEFGRQTARDRALRADVYRGANTSCSALLRDPATGAVRLHLLFDVGLGVVNSLIDAGRDLGVTAVDAVFITHPHLDHFAELDRLANSLRRAAQARGDHGRRLPVYCTARAAARLFDPDGICRWLAEAGRGGRVTPVPVEPCVPTVFHVDGRPALTVTPISVWHGPSAPGAVIYVVEGGGRKVVFGWDVLRVVEAPDAPSPAEAAAGVTALPVAYAGLPRDADLLFLDTNTWRPRPTISHISALEGLALALRWRVHRLYFIHYSGQEDAILRDDPPLNPVVDLPDVRVTRPLTDPELHWLSGRVSAALDFDVRAAYTGMIVPDTEPWPDAWPPAFT